MLKKLKTISNKILFVIKKHIKSLSDEDIIAKYKKNGNNKYIGELYERYYHLVFGVCLKYLKSIEDSEDAVVSIFEKLIKELKSSNILKFKNWLYMVTKNHCLSQLRKKKFTNFVEIEKNLSIEKDTLLNKLNKEKLYEILEQKIEELSNEQKICIKLFYLQNNSYMEVSNLTGFEVKKVKSYIQNGKRKLGILLNNKYKELTS